MLPAAQVEIVKLPDLSGLNASQATDKFLDSEEFYVERGLRVVSEVFEQVGGALLLLWL